MENLFLHMASVLHEAGGDWTDVAKITFFATDVGAVIGMINAAWTRHFPDEASRPSRHCQTVPAYGDGILVCCEFLAFLPD